MRFIFNFFFYGLLFYLIYIFFPDAFFKLVSWVDQIYEFIRTLFIQASSKVQEAVNKNEQPKEALLLCAMMRSWIKDLYPF